MKFSPRKKAKMRKIRQRKINRECKNLIGFTVDYENGYEVKDQAKINNTMYLLVKVENNQFAIYKIVKPAEYVRLSYKRVLQNQKDFSNYAKWYNHSTLEITDEGLIKSVKKTIRQVVMKNGKPTYEYVVI